jgi:hypothetical protein
MSLVPGKMRMTPRLKNCCRELLMRGYERVPAPLGRLIGRTRRVLTGLAELRVPVAWYTGKTPGGLRMRVLTAGEGQATHYFLGRIFADEPTRTLHGSALLASLPRLLPKLRGEADLTIAEMDHIAARLLFSSDYLRVPSWVTTTLAVPDDVEAVARRSSSTRSDLKLIRDNGLRMEESHRRDDFQSFYYDMYLPFSRQRHGELTIVRPERNMRLNFRDGGLLWILQGNQRVAGGIYECRKGVMTVVCFGTAGGEYEPVRQGGLAALYLSSAQHAKKVGCTLLNFGLTRACARDGVLRYKRKWGMRFSAEPRMRVELLMRWERPGPCIEEFITHSPLLFRDGRGLSMLAASPELAPESLRDQLWINGIDRLHVIGRPRESAGGLPRDVVLGDPLHSAPSAELDRHVGRWHPQPI